MNKNLNTLINEQLELAMQIDKYVEHINTLKDKLKNVTEMINNYKTINIFEDYNYNDSLIHSVIINGVEIKISSWKELLIVIGDKYTKNLTTTEFFEIFKSAKNAGRNIKTAYINNILVVNNYSANTIVKMIQKLMKINLINDVKIRLK